MAAIVKAGGRESKETLEETSKLRMEGTAGVGSVKSEESWKRKQYIQGLEAGQIQQTFKLARQNQIFSRML